MFVLSKRNIVIPAPDGSAAVRLRAGMMETVPGWAAETDYFRAEQFQEDFPQFFTGLGESLLPRTMLDEFIRQANAAIQPDKWLDGWRYAAGLYTAHYATLYLKTYAPSSETPGQAAATGALVGVEASAKLGQHRVTYDTDALTKATEDWGDLNATQYGQLLATKARLVGMGGSYVL